MKFIIVEPAYPINSRTERFYQSIVNEFGENSIKVICWNRDGRPLLHKMNYIVYDEIVGYGNPKAKLNGLRGFKKFLKRNLLSEHPDFILASHWDSLILSAMVKPKFSKLIYENLDMPTGHFPVRHVLRVLEKWALGRTDCITFASRFFIPKYTSFKREKLLIENKLPKSMCSPIPEKEDNSILRICFLGVVRHAVIMENLMKAISNIEDVQFDIFGGGPFYDDIKRIAECYSNVIMHGPYNYNDIPDIYAQADLIWAVYPYHDYNVKLAISNKFHETLHFGVPGIFCKGTKLGDMVNEKKIGLVVDCDSVEDIHDVISNYKKNKKNLSTEININITNFLAQENSCWEDEFKPFMNYIRKNIGWEK